MITRACFYDYFDVDEISTREETVPVQFLVSSFTLASDIHLTHQREDTETVLQEGNTNSNNPSSSMKDVRAGQTALLPLWAAEPLHQEGFISVTKPPAFELSTFREFKTDSLAPSLFQKSPYFYDSGLRVCRLIGIPTSSGMMSTDGNRLAAQLVRLYQLRYFKIVEAVHKKGFDLSDVREKLVESERFLLDILLAGKAQEIQWHKSVV